MCDWRHLALTWHSRAPAELGMPGCAPQPQAEAALWKESCSSQSSPAQHDSPRSWPPSSRNHELRAGEWLASGAGSRHLSCPFAALEEANRETAAPSPPLPAPHLLQDRLGTRAEGLSQAPGCREHPVTPQVLLDGGGDTRTAPQPSNGHRGRAGERLATHRLQS